jgi:hypothetical protein
VRRVTRLINAAAAAMPRPQEGAAMDNMERMQREQHPDRTDEVVKMNAGWIAVATVTVLLILAIAAAIIWL